MSISPRGYDRGLRVLEKVPLASLRRQLLSEVKGNVLELGAGSGANFVFYGPDVRVTAIDLRESNLQSAVEKSSAMGPGAPSVLVANAQDLPFATGEFDAVVATLVFCSIQTPEVALREICRVLRPNGTLHLLEHVRGQGQLSRLLTDVFHPLWYALQGECHLNRETAATVAEAGFTLERTSIHGRGLLQMITAGAPSQC